MMYLLMSSAMLLPLPCHTVRGDPTRVCVAALEDPHLIDAADTAQLVCNVGGGGRAWNVLNQHGAAQRILEVLRNLER